MIKILAAVDPTGLIGINQTVVWSRPADLKRFKNLTLNQTVVMGHKTFLSLKRPGGLPNRKNIVMTRHPEQIQTGSSNVKFHTDLIQYLTESKVFEPLNTIWIIGGAEIYQQALKSGLIDQIDLTILKEFMPIKSEDQLTYFPTIPYNFTVVKEEINTEDTTLLHRLYEIATW